MNPTNSLDEKKLIVHIGTPKTGSTSLEKFLYENRDVLKGCGYLYPEEIIRGYGHHDIAYLANGEYPKWAIPQDKTLADLINLLRHEIRKHHEKKIILSSEIFYLLSKPKEVARIIAELGFKLEDTRVIVYLRRQDEVHQSWYNQRVKAQGYTGEIDDSIIDSRDLWDYQKSLEPWRKIFGKKNIKIRLYEKSSLVGNDIRRDFIEVLGIDTENFKYLQKNTNSRLCRDLLEFQRYINSIPISFVNKRKYMHKLIELTNSSKSNQFFSDSPLLTNSQKKELMDSYEQANRYVAREYLDTDEIFSYVINRQPHNINNKTSLSLKKLSYILYWLLMR